MSDDPTLPADVRVVRYDVHEPVPSDALDAEVLVLWGNDPEQAADAARRLTGLRWVQTLAAGPDAALAAGFADDVVITSGRGLHDGPVAEHTLALVLAAARRVPDLVRAQAEHRWAGELGRHAGPAARPGVPDPRRRAGADLGLRVDRRPARARCSARWARRSRASRPSRATGTASR